MKSFNIGLLYFNFTVQNNTLHLAATAAMLIESNNNDLKAQQLMMFPYTHAKIMSCNAVLL